MTVSAQTPINRSTANGVTTVFPYTFKILAEGDIEVSVDGVVKTLTTDYTVSGVGVDGGGNVTMLAAPANATTIVRRRQMALTREVDYQDQGELPTDTLDDDQDAPILMIQQLQEGLDRAIKVSITSDVDPDVLIDELLAASEDATDAAATATAAAGTATAAAAAAAASAAAITLPIPVASGGTGATTAAAARTALGAGAFGSTLFATTDQAAARTALGVSDPVPVRQTVLSGPVDSSGFAAFVGATGSTTVTATGTLKATAAAGGDANYTGSITNPSWTGLSTNGTMYLFLDITSAGVVTTGSTTLIPTYQWGGTYSTTNLQNTFNIQEMTMKVGNGSAATQVYRVFVGEVTVAGSVVTAITWYALMGRYDSGYTNTLPGIGTATNRSHNLGIVPTSVALILKCLSTEGGWATGDVVQGVAVSDSTKQPVNLGGGTLTTTFTSGGATAFLLVHKSTGATFTLTAASWAYRVTANRGW